MKIGTKNITADGLVDSTKDTRIHSISVVADGTGATVSFKLGGSGGTEINRIVVAANTSSQQIFFGGMLFVGGCYVDVDAHTAYCTVTYERNS